MKRTEANLDAKVAKAVAKKHPQPNWALEVKTFKGRLKDHQKKALKKVEDGQFIHKLPDDGRRQPFDYVKLGDADALVCTIQENLRDVHCVVNGGVYDFNVRIWPSKNI